MDTTKLHTLYYSFTRLYCVKEGEKPTQHRPTMQVHDNERDEEADYLELKRREAM